MNPITLFDQDNVTVFLHDLYFDKEIDGVRASIEIRNRKGIGAHVVLMDLWDGQHYYDDYHSTLCSAPQRGTAREDFLHLNSEYGEENDILKFHNGYLPEFSFRLALYTHRKGTDTLKFCSKGSRIVVSKFSMDGVKVMPMETYRIESDGETLFASAKYYIPFEIPKADSEKAQQIQAFESELSNRIDSMEVAPWDVLVAKYGELGKQRFYDIENMCIYNLGTATFSRCCPTDIAFEEMSAKEIDRFQNYFGAISDQNCLYAYSSTPRKGLEEKCNSKQLFAEWSHISIDMDLPNSPHRYWASMRRQYERVSVQKVLKQPELAHFGIRVIIHLSRRTLPAGIMKPLLDGIVCAFHGRNSIDNILNIITQDAFDKMVVDAENSIALLGERNYLQPYRDGVKWNPADERLKFAWVSVVVEDCEPYFEGKLFAWDSE